MKISGYSPSGKRWESRQMAYCAEGCERLFLSKTACVDLGILEQDFPKIGRFDDVNDCNIEEILERSVTAELASAELNLEIENRRRKCPDNPMKSLYFGRAHIGNYTYFV